MNRRIVVILFLLLLLSLVACGRPANGVATSGSAASTEPAAAPAQEFSSPQESIAATDTVEALRALITTYQAAGDQGSAYLAARKLLELDPADSQAYRDAITALLSEISGNYTAIQELITLGIQQSPETASDFSHWAGALNQTFSFKVPFVADYASPDEANTVGITPGNLTNTEVLFSELWQNGLLTTQGDWVYFMMPTEDYYIYKMHLDGTLLTKVGDARGDNVNVVGDWLYYRNLNDAGMVYRIRTDGTQKEGPIFNKAVMMSVTSDWIYYFDQKIYKTRTDGSETLTILDDPCDYLSMYDDWIYYNTGGDNSEFLRVSVEGGEPQKLLDGWTSHFTFENGWMYYLNNRSGNAVCRMRPDGSESSVVYSSDDMIGFFNLAGGKLAVSVCREADDRGKPYPTDLVIVDLATNGVLKTLKQSAGVLYSAKDMLYFRDEQENWHLLNLTTLTQTVLSSPSVAAKPVEEQPQQQAPAVVGNTAGNLAMQIDGLGSGLFVQNGETIYFANPFDGGCLYSAAQNGSAPIKKLLNASVANLNLVDQTIYYSDLKNKNAICSVNTDGTNQAILQEGAFHDLAFCDDWLYFRSDNIVHRLNKDGEKIFELATGRMRSVYAAGGWVYYIEDHEAGGLWRVPAEGGDKQPLFIDHPVKSFAMEDDSLYLIVDGGNSVDVIRMRLDGSEQAKIFSANEKLNAININEGRPLIVKSSEDGVHSMILILNSNQYTVENKIDGLTQPVVWSHGQSVYYLADDGLIRQNLNTEERVVITK